MMPRTAGRLVLLMLACSLAACGDAPTTDHRGFTKAPLESAGIFITSEQPSPYRQFARFNRPDGQRITLPDSAG